MKPVRFLIIILFVIAINSSAAIGTNTYRKLKIKKENLRASPKGTIIAEVLSSARMWILEEKGKWIKVQITGWIWKPSTVPSKPPATSKKFYPHNEFLQRADEFSTKLAVDIEHIKKIIQGYEFGTVSLSKLYEVMEPYANQETPEIVDPNKVMAPGDLTNLQRYLSKAFNLFRKATRDFNPLTPRYKEKKPKIGDIKDYIQECDKEIAKYSKERSKL